MKGNIKHLCLNLFMMLAIVGAAISPACKFISGEMTWMEICGVDGIKKVRVANDAVPGEEKQEHANSDPCAFCVTHASVKIAPAAATEIRTPISNAVVSAFFYRDGLVSSQIFTTLRARGPPQLS